VEQREHVSRIKYNGKTTTYVFCDTDGQDESFRMRREMYMEVNLFVITFSVISPYSFDNVRTRWITELTRHGPPGVPVMLVGTRIDLRNDEEALKRLTKRKMAPISYAQGVDMKNEINALCYVECSSLTMEGIDGFLEEICNSTSEKETKNKKKKGLFSKKKKVAKPIVLFGEEDDI